ncbi:MAG: HAMP domain-containing histidine kinase [Cyclobacteriaceae bacterium]
MPNQLKKIKLLVFLLSLVFSFNLNGQSQSVADSLKHFVNKDLSDSVLISTYSQLLRNEQNRDTLIYYAHRFLDLSIRNNDRFHIHKAYADLGIAHREKGDLEKSLEYLLSSLSYATNKSDEAISLSNLGGVYDANQNFENAVKNYKMAFKIFMEIDDSLRSGTTSISLGYGYFQLVNLDSSAYFCNVSKKIFEDISYEYKDYYWAYAEGNMALVNAKRGLFDSAELSLDTAITILKKYQDEFAICDYDFQLAKIYFERGEIEKAIGKAKASYLIAQENGFKEFIRNGAEILSKFYNELGDYKEAYEYQNQFISYKDSLLNADLIRQLADQQKEYEVGQKQAELDVVTAQQKAERVILLATVVLVIILVILAFTIYKYYRSKAKVNKILEAQKVELESLNSTKDKFFSIISHDLRGPVTSFFGISRMIKYLVQSKETDQLLEIADDIDRSVERLSSLLDNLLSWAVQQQGQFPHEPEAINFEELAQNTVETFANMANGKKINLKAEVEEGLTLWADKKMTETIVRNLVSNSLKFTPDSGAVTIAASKNGKGAHLKISDTGVGIPEDKLENLFKLQAKKSTFGTSGEKGLGLGLQLVYEFIGINNGNIEVESKDGEGTTFHIHLPLSQD